MSANILYSPSAAVNGRPAHSERCSKFDAPACCENCYALFHAVGPSRNSHAHAAARNGDARYPANPEAAPPPETQAPEAVPLTDLGNGQRFAREHGANVRYCHPWRRWLVWDGTRWRIDDAGRAMALAKETISGLYRRIKAQIDQLREDDSDEGAARLKKIKAVLDFALKSQHVNRLKAMLDLAKSEPGIPILPASLDRDPMLLNVVNGTLDLRSGELRPHRQEDYLTKIAPVAFDPSATCPRWENFLSEIFDCAESLTGYMQRLVGFWLTGDVREHALPIPWGCGANGKSTFIGTILDLLGDDYACKASRDLMTTAKGDKHPTTLAMLHGKRLVVAIETGEGARLDEALVKELTGADKVTARRMREDYWCFMPTHKLALVTNHKPTVRGMDHAIWRRLRLIPFNVTFPESKQNKTLPDKLRAELPGILNWAIAGCLTWQRHGLADPPEVLAATAEYRSEQDRLGEFLTARCQLNPEFRAKAGDLYGRYKKWCEASSERALTGVAFGMAMGERGIQKDAGRRWYRGIALTSDDRE